MNDLGQIAVAALGGNADAAVWLLRRLPLEEAFRRMQEEDDGAPVGVTLH